MIEQELREHARAHQIHSAAVQDVRLHARSLFSIYRVAFDDGTLLAAKVVDSVEMAACEADGLAALSAAGAPVPRVCGHYPTRAGAALWMEFLEPGQNSTAGKIGAPRPIDQLEADLIALYESAPPSHGAEGFGWHRHNFIGALPQPNSWHASFGEFFWRDRLEPRLRAAMGQGLLDGAAASALEAVHGRCVDRWDLNGSRPRLIHGDLWNGNVLAGPGERLHLIDPSVACGHPEQDLGMLQLFGSPLSAAGAIERIALQVGCGPGFAERTAYWQIYPLLVHINLFGRSYVPQLRQALKSYQ